MTENSSRATLTVLIVDDDPEMVDVVSILLSLDGLNPLKALGAKEGLELALSERPDVILLDIMMPDMDGFQVFSELQRNPGSADIPVIFLTARTQEEYRRRAFGMGASAYVTKPYSRKELFHAIQKAASTVSRSGTGVEEARPRGPENEGGHHSEADVIRVIIVDDDPDEVSVVKEALVHGGAYDYSIKSTNSLDGFLETKGQEEVDITLLNLNLPESKGLETLERLQRETGATPIIVLSEKQDEAIAVEAVRRGALDYLVKDGLDSGLLSRSIRYSLERKAAGDELDRYLERLERVVEERTADLRAMNRELAEAGELMKQEVEERKRGHEEVERLTRKLMEEDEEIKALVSRELHDQVSQALSGLKLTVGSIKVLIEDVEIPREVAAAKLALVETELSGTLSRVRNLLNGLRPPILEHFGLSKAIECHVSAFSDESGIVVEFSSDRVPDSLPQEHELQLFRIIQEGLQNVRNHSDAGKVCLRLEGGDSNLRLVLRDDGRGFAIEDLKDATLGGHFGVLGMRERAAIMHAALDVQSVPGEGTTITVEVPLERE